MNIEAIADFIIKYSPKNKEKTLYTEKDREKIKEIIVKHIYYKTCVIFSDLDGIVSICRFNMSPSGKVARILDIIIHPKYREKDLMRKMLLKGLRIFPQGEFIEFERSFVENDKGFRSYPIKKFLRFLGRKKQGGISV